MVLRIDDAFQVYSDKIPTFLIHTKILKTSFYLLLISQCVFTKYITDIFSVAFLVADSFDADSNTVTDTSSFLSTWLYTQT